MVTPASGLTGGRLEITEHTDLRIGTARKSFKGAKVGGGHRKDQVPALEFPRLNLASTMRRYAIPALAQGARSPRIDAMPVFFIADARGINKNIDPAIGSRLAKDLLGHHGAANVAGADHQD